MSTTASRFYNTDAERRLVFTIIAYSDNKGLLDGLSPEWFYETENQRIIAAARAIRAKGKVPDLVTLLSHTNDPNLCAKVNEYRSAEGFEDRYDAKQYVDIIHKLYERRQALTAIDALRKDFLETDIPTDELLAKTSQTVNELERSQSQEKVRDLQQVLLSTYQTLCDRAEGKITTVSTGIPTLDKLTGGLFRGEMTVIGARPGTGKTALTLQIAEMAALAHQRVVFVSREMSETQIGERIFARHGINMARSRVGRLRADDWDIAAEVMGNADLKNILIDNRSTTAAKIRTTCRKWAAKGGLDLVCIDYLQLIHPEDGKGTRNDQVAGISWAMKELSIELNVPVLLLSQLNRESIKQRPDPRPILSDLRDSGSIEQDADNVWMLWCPEKSADPETQTMIEFAKNDGNAVVLIECEKARQSVVGTVRTTFLKSQMRFADTTAQEYKEEKPNEQVHFDGESLR